MHRRVQRRTESWGAVVVDKPPDPPAEREPGRVQAAAQSDGVTVTSQAVAERWMHQRVQRRTESWGAVVVDKPPDSPAEREPGRMHAVAQSGGMTVTPQAVGAQPVHQRVQRRTESWGAVVMDKPPDSPAEREPSRRTHLEKSMYHSYIIRIANDRLVVRREVAKRSRHELSHGAHSGWTRLVEMIPPHAIGIVSPHGGTTVRSHVEGGMDAAATVCGDARQCSAAHCGDPPVIYGHRWGR